MVKIDYRSQNKLQVSKKIAILAFFFILLYEKRQNSDFLYNFIKNAEMVIFHNIL
jgi:hypothetical protein